MAATEVRSAPCSAESIEENLGVVPRTVMSMMSEQPPVQRREVDMRRSACMPCGWLPERLQPF
jgi:hypothetical protein